MRSILCQTLLLCVSFLMMGCGAVAQNFTTVNGSNVQNSSGTKLASGSACFRATDANGNPISYRAGGGGSVTSAPVCVAVTTGAFTLSLANTTLTSPVNVCYNAYILDNATKQYVVGSPDINRSRLLGYQCLQPQTTSSWCTAGTCNFDNFTPSLPGLVPTATGPVGATGPACSSDSACVNTSTNQTVSGIKTITGTLDFSSGNITSNTNPIFTGSFNSSNNLTLGGGAIGSGGGDFNTGLGMFSFMSRTTGQQNTAIGYTAGHDLTSAFGNTIIGSQACRHLITGSRNICIGAFAGYLEDQAGSGSTSVSNSMFVGGAGNSEITDVYWNGNYSNSQTIVPITHHGEGAGGTNQAGGDIGFAGGQGTGTGVGGKVIFSTALHSTTGSTKNTLSTRAQINEDGSFQFSPFTFATLPATPVNGMFLYCSDCTIANPTASGGNGAFVKRLNGVWVGN